MVTTRGATYPVAYACDALGHLPRRACTRGVATDDACLQGSDLLAGWASNAGMNFTRAFVLSHC